MYTVVVFHKGMKAQQIETQSFEMAINWLRDEDESITVTIWRNSDNRQLVVRYGKL